MIEIQDIYNKSHDGLDIIASCFPDARLVAQGEMKKFKIREENTPSASLIKNKSGVYVVHDFGSGGQTYSPIDLYMEFHGIQNFRDAIALLASEYGVGAISSEINKPRTETRAATQEEKEGEIIFSLKESIPEKHLKILGPRVTQEIASSLHWYEAEYTGTVKDRKVHLRYSTDHYPIFIRECAVPAANGKPGRIFYKIYEPLNPEKGFRFKYTPKGCESGNYINGLEELKVQYNQLNKDAESEDDKENSGPKRIKKLEEAVICSGERDALCCRSQGYAPIWFNSETYNIKDSDIREIRKYVDVIYNIPDLDETGVRQGIKRALQFMEIRTVWLDAWLMNFRDPRGKRKKDLRDWMEQRPDREDFRKLLHRASPACFWIERYKGGRREYDIDWLRLKTFLEYQGFCTYKDPSSMAEMFVKVENHIVTQVSGSDIRRYIREWAYDEGLNEDILRSLAVTKNDSDANFEQLKMRSFNFKSHTSASQYFFFKDQAVVVTKDGARELPKNGSIERFVWKEKIIPHRFRKLDDMFEATYEDASTFDIKIKGEVNSYYLGYLINSSRLYWREEMEKPFKNAAERAAYKATHKYCIDGEGLSAEQIAEQKLTLLSKMFCIGYAVHRHKSPSRGWALFSMDNKIGEDGECNGRSGKSFFFIPIGHITQTLVLDARQKKSTENKHLLELCKSSTDLIVFDDLEEKFDIGSFYGKITNDLNVNPKGKSSYVIKFEDSPKFGFTTNYVPGGFDPSTQARMLYMIYSDYYHEKSETNDYLETRKVSDDFGGDIFTSEFQEDAWNVEINFILQCVQFYLTMIEKGVKIQPPMDNIKVRMANHVMGVNFKEWADNYFSESSGNLDTYLVKNKVFEDFLCFSKIKTMTAYAFKRRLAAFVDSAPHIECLNPPEICDRGTNRITWKALIENDPEERKKSTEFIYYKSVGKPVKPRPKEATEDSNVVDNIMFPEFTNVKP